MSDNECSKKIKDFLNQLDSVLEQISESEVSNRIKKFAKEEFGQNPPETLMLEQMAFDFVEDYPDNKTGWGTYFGPMFIWPDEEGRFVEYPSISKITPTIIDYWKSRTKEVNYPVLKARFSSLVWDFSGKIIGEKLDYLIAQIFVDSVIEIADKNLHKSPTNVIRKLERALSLALTINDKERIDKMKNIIIHYENKIAEDDKPGLWGFPYKLLIGNKRIPLTEEEEKEIIRTLEQRFDRLLKGDDIDPAQRATDLLVDYYTRVGNEKEVKSILLKLGNMIRKKAEEVPALVGGGWLEELYHLYLLHGLKEEADKISIKIKELGAKGTSELKKIETSIKLSKNEIDEFINQLIEGNLQTALIRTANYYIPKRDDVIKQLKEFSKDTPILFNFFSRKMLDREGRVIATVGSLENDIDGHIALQISQNMNFDSFFLRETINALIHKFSLNVETILDYLYECPIFEEKRKQFLIRGIKAYLDGDFFFALHILIPQIEALIRNLTEKIGVSVLKPSRSGGFYYKTLDELLRDENIIEALKEDMCLYLRILLTDPRGWNLRNNVCHGISPIETFNQIVTDRVFHVLLCLSLIREKEDIT